MARHGWRGMGGEVWVARYGWRWLVARDSWLVARGLWLMARASCLVSWLVPRAPWLVARGSCLVPRASCPVPVAHGSWLVARVSWPVARGSCLMPRAPCPVPRAATRQPYGDIWSHFKLRRAPLACAIGLLPIGVRPYRRVCSQTKLSTPLTMIAHVSRLGKSLDSAWVS